MGCCIITSESFSNILPGWAQFSFGGLCIFVNDKVKYFIKSLLEEIFNEYKVLIYEFSYKLLGLVFFVTS